MDHWDSSFYPHCLLFSFMEIYEGSNVLPKDLKDLHIPSHSNLTHPYHSIPPHSTASCPSLPTGINFMDNHEGSPALTSYPNSLHPSAAWLHHCTYHPSVLAGFNAHLPWVYCSYLSHVLALIAPSIMSSPRSRPHPHFTLNHGSVHYVISPERILLDVIAGVDEGWL